MKYNFIRTGAILVVIVAIASMAFLSKTPDTPVKQSGNGFAVIELFTSEGCSSCPAADEEVSKVATANPQNVYVLGFHVDYWNRLGWKDEFSEAAYSDRQRKYADHFKLSGVYTPQVVVNGKKQLVGSDASGLEKSVHTEIINVSNHPIALSATGSAGEKVQVNYSLQAIPNMVVNIALVQVAAQTDVKRGENEGKVLHHINIVRDFKTNSVSGKEGTATLTIPKGLTAKDCRVIAYLQNQDNREIISVATANIQ